MRRTDVAHLLDELSGMYPNAHFPESALDTWCQALAEVPVGLIDQVKPAILRAHQEFCPPLPVWLAAIDEALLAPYLAGADNANAAWAEVMDQMRHPGAWGVPSFSNPVIHAVVRGMAPTWVDFCSMDLKDVGFAQNRFLKTYAAEIERAKNDIRALRLPLALVYDRQAVALAGGDEE